MRRLLAALAAVALTACGSATSLPTPSPSRLSPALFTSTVSSLPSATSKFCVAGTCFATADPSLLKGVKVGDCVYVTAQRPLAQQAATLISLKEVGGCDLPQNEVPHPPFLTSLPNPWPVAHVVRGGCLITDIRPSTWYPAQLPASAESASLLWYSGLAIHTCRSAVTTLNAAQAEVLLTDLHNATGPYPGATYHCPMDDGRFVQIWFKTSRGYTSFRINLAGCVFYLPRNHADLGTWPSFIHPW